MFKIRNQDGLFSSGGCRPDWRKGGKAWRTLGHVKSHLNMVEDLDDYKNCELVEVVQIVATQKKLPDFIAECEQQKKNKEIERKKSQERWEKQQRKLEYNKLKKEFD